MPIRELSEELVLDIIESYGQITKLNLSTNEISRIENLQHLTCLTNLDLFCNRLGSVPGSLAGLAPLTRLKNLDISENNIASLEPLSSAPVSLTRLDVAHNSITGTFQISYLASLTALTELVLAGNPVAEEEDYPDMAFTTLSSLHSLDHAPREHHNHHQETSVGNVDGSQPAHVPSGGDSIASWRTGLEPYLASPFENMPPPPANPHPSPDSSVAAPPSSPGDSSGNRSGSDVEEAQALARQDAGIGGERLEAPFENPSADPGSAFPAMTCGPRVSGSVETDPRWDRNGGLAVREAPGGGAFGGESSPSGGAGVFGNEGDSAGLAEQREMGLMADAVEQASTSDGLRERTPVDSVMVAAASTGLPTPAGLPAPGYTRDTWCPGQNAEDRAADKVSDSCGAGTDVERAEGPGSRQSRPESLLGLSSSGERPRVALESEAAGRTSASFAWCDDLGGVGEDESGKRLPIGAATDGHRPPGSGSNRESTLDHRNSNGQPYACSRSGVDYGNTATLRTIRKTKHAITDDAGFDTLPDSGHQEALARMTAAAAPAAPARVAEDRRAITTVALDREEGVFGRQGQTPTHTVELSERRPSVDQLAAPASGSGEVEVSTADGFGDRDHYHRSRWERVEAFGVPLPATVPRQTNKSMSFLGSRARVMSEGHVKTARGGGEAETVVVSRGEWEALKHENDTLRRQAMLMEKRCAALTEMQRLADNALCSAHPPPFSFSSGAKAAPTGSGKHAQPQEESRGGVLSSSLSLSSSSSSSLSAGGRPEDQSRERPAVVEITVGEANQDEEKAYGDQQEAGREGRQADVTRLLAAWRAEVLKLLLQRGVDAEVAAEETRQARRMASEEREARGRAETEAKSLMQRALAAEAEAELLEIKLTGAFEELRADRAGRSTAEASSLGHATAVRTLREWVQGFVARASAGFFEREALLARAVAKLEAFSERLGLAAGRIKVLETILRHKEVQLRNSRAALVADRRVWLLERRDREIAALSSNPRNRRLSPARLASSHQTQQHPRAKNVGLRGRIPLDSSRSDSSGGTMAKDDGIRDDVRGGVSGGSSAITGGAVAIQSPLLEGLRPECEAVMRALFCRVDRLGTGAVRARRLLSVLRSDCGVSEVMEAAVGRPRWRTALDSMEAELCPPPVVDTADAPGAERGSVGEGRISPRSSAERDVTWGEFLLFFLPSAGSADDAYNAGLVFHAGGSGAGGTRHRSSSFGAVSEDAAAMLQMVVPDRWTASGGSYGASPSASSTGAPGGGDVILGQGLAALSVGQLRREVLRLAREREFLLALVREDCRVGKRRAEAVHDQYRHELRALHGRIGGLERSLQQVSCRADVEQEKAVVAQQELSRSHEEAKKVEQEWKRRIDATITEKAAALEESSREASKSANTARERISRLEAQHSLALRENGKASVRQRALERELARIKSSMQAEADVEREALEERLRAGESKLATARRERNALLAALRDLQKRGRSGSDPLSLFAPSSDLEGSRGGGAGMAVQDLDEDSGGDRGSVASVGGVESIVPTVGQENIQRQPPCTSDVATPVLVSVQGSRAKSEQERVTPKVVQQPRVSRGMVGSGGGVDEGAASVGFGGQRCEGEWQGLGSRGLVHGDAARAASLSARLEALALQTQRLLADGSDTSYSADDTDSD